MDLGLNEIQTMLQNLAREFMETEMPTTRVLEIDDSPSGFAVEVWKVAQRNTYRICVFRTIRALLQLQLNQDRRLGAFVQ